MTFDPNNSTDLNNNEGDSLTYSKFRCIAFLAQFDTHALPTRFTVL